MKMNLPNKLSVLRLCMVPVFVVIMMASVHKTNIHWPSMYKSLIA